MEERMTKKDFGRLISKAYPLRNDTPADFIKLLEKLG
jgi:hypothetical protein